MTVTIHPLTADDRSDWETLFAGYAAFYRVAQTAQMRETVFGWLMDPDHTSKCLLAVDVTGGLSVSHTTAPLLASSQP